MGTYSLSLPSFRGFASRRTRNLWISSCGARFRVQSLRDRPGMTRVWSANSPAAPPPIHSGFLAFSLKGAKVQGRGARYWLLESPPPMPRKVDDGEVGKRSAPGGGGMNALRILEELV